MNRQWAGSIYSTRRTDDNIGGCSNIMLYRDAAGCERHIASITFWDSVGQFVVETHGAEVPLEIMEELIAEAKREIPIR